MQIGFPVAQMVKNLPAMQEIWVPSLGWEHPLKEGMTTYSRFLPGESSRTEESVGCSPWGHKESDMTERLSIEYARKRVGNGV